MSMGSGAFMELADVVAAFEELCRADPRYTYLIRQHPNRPITLPEGARHGMLDDGSLLGPEDAILVSDIVCVEVSTMGVEAALKGKPVICVGFDEYSHYPKFGLGQSAADMDEAVAIIRAGPADTVAKFEMPPLGNATTNVLAYVDDILSKHAGSFSSNQTDEEPQ
jgi:hypothetical protein